MSGIYAMIVAMAIDTIIVLVFLWKIVHMRIKAKDIP